MKKLLLIDCCWMKICYKCMNPLLLQLLLLLWHPRRPSVLRPTKRSMIADQTVRVWDLPPFSATKLADQPYLLRVRVLLAPDPSGSCHRLGTKAHPRTIKLISNLLSEQHLWQQSQVSKSADAAPIRTTSTRILFMALNILLKLSICLSPLQWIQQWLQRQRQLCFHHHTILLSAHVL